MEAQSPHFMPLASRMRPTTLAEFKGQSHLLAHGKPFRQAIEQGKLHSMILWGPPGTGKTTLALLIAKEAEAEFISLSAVVSGVKELREVAQRAERYLQLKIRTLLFVDEVHHFNKTQQDLLLPYLEAGTFTLIGATTENPSFSLNNALLSRAKIYVLKPLNLEEMEAIIDQALSDPLKGLGQQKLILPDVLKKRLAEFADGDARAALNLLDLMSELAGEEGIVTESLFNETLGQGIRRFDNKGDDFYQQISVLHKAVRGSAPDAALYWLVRMLDAGCDPRYLARRIIRMATEDIGNADPRALTLALNAAEVQERLGSPEGELALAQAVIYLACAPKSNAVYTAFQAAQKTVKEKGSLPVPERFRNATTRLMKELGYGEGYRYAHDEPEGYAAGEEYFPEALAGTEYYHPVQRGLEIKIAEKLARLRALDKS